MNPAISRILTHGLALLAGAATVFLLTAQQRSELQQLRTEARLWRESTARADALREDYATLRGQYEELASRMPKPNELARLRANASELQRLRQELAETRRAVDPAPQTSLSPPAAASEAPPQLEAGLPPSPPFTMTGTIGLDFGSTVVSGGWELEPGQRGFVMATPVLLEDATIMMEARLLSVPDNAISSAGLTELLANSRHSEQYGVTDPEETRALLSSLERLPGVEVLAGPRVVTSPNTEAELSVIKGAPGEGIVLKFNPRPRLDGSSLDLDMNVELTAPSGQ